MHPSIKNTRDIETPTLKFLVYGPSGSGKTRLCGTTGGKPLIISAEAGLLSLAGQSLDIWEIKNIEDLRAAYTYLLTDTVYDWVCIDSISEVAEVVLAAEKKLTKDGRKAYGEMGEQMAALVRCFRDLPKNVYMSAKMDKLKDEMTGGFMFGPSAPGQRVGAYLPYYFDEVFVAHRWKDEAGQYQSALQTQRDAQYEAKDRSGALAPAEPADLGAIHAKIKQHILNQTNKE